MLPYPDAVCPQAMWEFYCAARHLKDMEVRDASTVNRANLSFGGGGGRGGAGRGGAGRIDDAPVKIAD